MPKTVDIKLALNNDEALILSSCMSLKKDNNMHTVIVAALEAYAALLRAKKNQGLIQVWYPNNEGKIVDFPI